MTASELPQFERVRVLEHSIPIDDVELTNQDEQVSSLQELRGKVVLVFFGFTNCPDICPTTITKLQAFQASTDYAGSDLAFVMISVDGDRDTPVTMKRYLAQFSDTFIGLTGDVAIAKQIAKQFRAPFYKGQMTSDDGNYSVAHSPQVFVVDAEGRLRAELYNASLNAMAGIVNALIAERATSEST